MKTYRIATIPGDGIGKEVVPAGQQVLAALAAAGGGFNFAFTDFDWGGDYYRRHGGMMPADGLDALRVVATVAARLLKPGGWVCAEHADLQHESAPAVFARHGGFVAVHDQRDYNDRPRFVTARRAAAMAGWPS